MKSCYQAPPRIAAVHDLSCFGRCALTVVIPTLSVMGYQVVPIPTALLSTHTGGFTDLHFRDLTEDMEAITRHFHALDLRFRSIYTGFLGSEAQIDSVQRLLADFGRSADTDGETPLILVDPVMGDDGVLYSTYTPALVRGMQRLARHATVLTPNLTEACLLTDTPYRDTRTLSPEEATRFAGELLSTLERDGCPRIVITGIHLSDGRLLNLGRDADGSRFSVLRQQQGRPYPGTGDLFASVLLGTLLRGASFERACAAAADFTAEVIRYSSASTEAERNGVALEPCLSLLCDPDLPGVDR